MNLFRPAAAKAATLRNTFALARQELAVALIERDDEIECAV